MMRPLLLRRAWPFVTKTFATRTNVPLLSLRHLQSSEPLPPRQRRSPIVWATACILSIIAGISSELWWHTRSRKAAASKRVTVNTVDCEYVKEDSASKPNLTNQEHFSVLRKLQSLEDLFQYFASITKSSGNGDFDEKFMTVYDLLRALVMDTRPITGEFSMLTKDAMTHISSILSVADTNYDGLVSYDEFLFLLQLLNTPLDKLELAFKVLDVDRSATVELSEFHKLFRPHRLYTEDPIHVSQSPNTQYKSTVLQNSLLTEWFGKHGDKKLEFTAFATFLNHLQDLVTRLLFESHNVLKNDLISGKSFALIMINNAHFRPFLDVFQQRFYTLDKTLAEVTISITDLRSFEQFTKQLNEFEVALHLLSARNRMVDKIKFARAVKAVSDCQLSQHQLDIMFHLFDKNGDGKLNYAEFKKLLLARRGYKLTPVVYENEDNEDSSEDVSLANQMLGKQGEGRGKRWWRCVSES